MSDDWLDEINWTEDGLVPVIAQQHDSGRVVMFAWMNRESLALSVNEGFAVYWSRSRSVYGARAKNPGIGKKLSISKWIAMPMCILLKIEQQGGIACHTGRESCFYRSLENGVWADYRARIKRPQNHLQISRCSSVGRAAHS